MVRRTDQPPRRNPVARTLAYVVVRMEWRGHVIEHELEVSDSVDWSTLERLVDLAYERASDQLREFGEQLERVQDEEDAADEVDPLPTVAQTVGILSLVGVTVTATQAAEWSGRKRLEAVRWASAVHLSASDNDVEIPARPEFLGPEFLDENPGFEQQVREHQDNIAASHGLKLVDPYLQSDLPARDDPSATDAEAMSDLPARGGQCRAIVVRQKEHAEVREPCGYQLGRLGEYDTCPNYAAHLQAHELRVSDIPGLEPTDPGVQRFKASLKEQLAEQYIDRYGSPPPEDASVEYLREAVTRD